MFRQTTVISPFRAALSPLLSFFCSLHGMEQSSNDEYHEDEIRSTKRQRQLVKKSTSKSLFAPFRALGIISNGVPFAVQSRSSKDISKSAITIVTCTGYSWAMWDVSGSMRLLFVGQSSPNSISCNYDDRERLRKFLTTIMPSVLRKFSPLNRACIGN